EILEQEHKKSPMRFDILAEIGKADFLMHDYASAAVHYDSALKMMNMFGMDILKHEGLRIGLTYEHVGDTAKAHQFFRQYQTYVDQDQTIYHDVNQASLLLRSGKKKEAMDLITRFADTHDYFHYLLLLIDVDPICEDIFEEKQFKDAVKKMNENFLRTHKAM